MVNNITELEANTFQELLSAVEEFQSDTTASWYRGSSSSAHKLTPTLFRHRTKKNIAELLELERSISTRFMQRSIPYISRPLIDEWDKMFFMQHYGVPTRLLDWTENPLVAAYFAVTGATIGKRTDAVIWMCDPIEWNRASLSHISYSQGILDQSSSIINGHKPGAEEANMASFPIMIFGSYNSARIVAQRAVFSLFGKSTKPLEELYREGGFKDGTIKRIIIPSEKVDSVRASLHRKGITESVVFPELDGLAKEIRREYEY